MLSHVMVGTNNIDKARKFYDAVFSVLGFNSAVDNDFEDRRRFVYYSDVGSFFVTQPVNGEEATHANGGTIGFRCKSTEQVDKWHAAAIAHGGSSIEEPPGVRDIKGIKLYLAYVRDPDGNKLCAAHRF